MYDGAELFLSRTKLFSVAVHRATAGNNGGLNCAFVGSAFFAFFCGGDLADVLRLVTGTAILVKSHSRPLMMSCL